MALVGMLAMTPTYKSSFYERDARRPPRPRSYIELIILSVNAWRKSAVLMAAGSLNGSGCMSPCCTVRSSSFNNFAAVNWETWFYASNSVRTQTWRSAHFRPPDVLAWFPPSSSRAHFEPRSWRALQGHRKERSLQMYAEL